MKLSKSDISLNYSRPACCYNHVHGAMNLNILGLPFKLFRTAYYQTHLISLSRLHKFYISLGVVKDIKKKLPRFH
jgi:hypothetical protein